MTTGDAILSQARRSYDLAVQTHLNFSDRRTEFGLDQAFRIIAGKNYEQFRTTAQAQFIQQALGFAIGAGYFGGGSAAGMYSGVSSSIGSGANNISTRDRYGNESLGRITSRDFATAEMSRLMYNSVNDRYFNAAGIANSRAMGFNRDDIGDLARIMRPSFGMAAMGSMVQGADGKVSATLNPEFEKMYHASMQSGLVNASILKDTFGARSQKEYARMGRMITGFDTAAPGGAGRITGRLRELSAMADANGEDRGTVMQLAAANKVYGQKVYGWGERFAGAVAHEATSNTMMAYPELVQAQAEAMKRGGYVAQVSHGEMSSLKLAAVGELGREDGGLIEAALHAVQTSPLMPARDREQLLSGVRAVGAGATKADQSNELAKLASTFSSVMGGASASSYTSANGGEQVVKEALNGTYASLAVGTRFKQDNNLIADQLKVTMSKLNLGGESDTFKNAMSGMINKLDLGTQQQVMGVLGDSSRSAAQKKSALYTAGINGGDATGILAGKLMSADSESQLAGAIGSGVIDAGREQQAMRVGTAWANDPTVKGAMTEEGRVKAEGNRAEIRGRAIKAGEDAYATGGIQGLISGFMGQGPVNADQALTYAVLRQKGGDKVEGLYSGEENDAGGVSMSTEALEKMKSDNPDQMQEIMATMGVSSINSLRDKMVERDDASAFKRQWEEKGGTWGKVNGKMQFLNAKGVDSESSALQAKNNANIVNDFMNDIGGVEKIGDITGDKVSQFATAAKDKLIANAGTAGASDTFDEQRNALVSLGRSGNADALPALRKMKEDVAAAETAEPGDSKSNAKKKALQDQMQNLDEAIKGVGGGGDNDMLTQIFNLLNRVLVTTGVPTKAQH